MTFWIKKVKVNEEDMSSCFSQKSESAALQVCSGAEVSQTNTQTYSRIVTAQAESHTVTHLHTFQANSGVSCVIMGLSPAPLLTLAL